MATSKMEKREFTLRDMLKDLLERPGARNDHELEVRFRTTSKARLTKIDFDNVIRKLKSLNFIAPNDQGEYQLKIQTEFTDVKTGRTKMSNIRTQITGIAAIQKYCNTNSIDSNDNSVSYMMKTYAKIGDDSVYPVNNDDFQFRISYQKEGMLTPKMPIIKQLISEWGNVKKNFRFINRVSFIHPNHPIRFDLSVVKSSINNRQYSVQDSGVFQNIEHYEIEIELMNNK